MGGWDTLNDWLQDVKEEENYPVLTELLKVYQALPVSVDILKTNNAAKTIKQLCKSENEGTVNLDGAVYSVRDYKYLSCVYGVDRKICHEGH